MVDIVKRRLCVRGGGGGGGGGGSISRRPLPFLALHCTVQLTITRMRDRV